MPGEPVNFTVKEGFFSEELGSEYVAGLTYTVGREDDRLRDLVAQWVEEGKVEIGGNDAVVVGKE